MAGGDLLKFQAILLQPLYETLMLGTKVADNNDVLVKEMEDEKQRRRMEAEMAKAKNKSKR